ncbi:hypothetical protein H8959_000287 [Pygathrix nigripes]
MSVTLHTDVGDIKIEVFCERTPKTCEETRDNMASIDSFLSSPTSSSGPGACAHGGHASATSETPSPSAR